MNEGKRVRTIEERVQAAAGAVLAERSGVSALDVFVEMGWLSGTEVELWQEGRVDSLEECLQVNHLKILEALRSLRHWAETEALTPSDTAYVSRSRDRHRLVFSRSGDEGLEALYGTQWLSPNLSEREKARVREHANRAPELVVVRARKDWACSVCGQDKGGLLFMQPKGPACLACVGLDHLAYLPAGDAGLTRRAKKHSSLYAVVVEWSRTRKRYERQGLLVEPEAIDAVETS